VKSRQGLVRPACRRRNSLAVNVERWTRGRQRSGTPKSRETSRVRDGRMAERESHRSGQLYRLLVAERRQETSGWRGMGNEPDSIENGGSCGVDR